MQKARTKETSAPVPARKRPTARKAADMGAVPSDEKLSYRIPRRHSPPLAHPMAG